MKTSFVGKKQIFFLPESSLLRTLRVFLFKRIKNLDQALYLRSITFRGENHLSLMTFLIIFKEIKPMFDENEIAVLFIFRGFNKSGIEFLKRVKPMLSDLNTYLTKVF